MRWAALEARSMPGHREFRGLRSRRNAGLWQRGSRPSGSGSRFASAGSRARRTQRKQAKAGRRAGPFALLVTHRLRRSRQLRGGLQAPRARHGGRAQGEERARSHRAPTRGRRRQDGRARQRARFGRPGNRRGQGQLTSLRGGGVAHAPNVRDLKSSFQKRLVISEGFGQAPWRNGKRRGFKILRLARDFPVRVREGPLNSGRARGAVRARAR